MANAGSGNWFGFFGPKLPFIPLCPEALWLVRTDVRCECETNTPLPMGSSPRCLISWFDGGISAVVFVHAMIEEVSW